MSFLSEICHLKWINNFLFYIIQNKVIQINQVCVCVCVFGLFVTTSHCHSIEYCFGQFFPIDSNQIKYTMIWLSLAKLNSIFLLCFLSLSIFVVCVWLLCDRKAKLIKYGDNREKFQLEFFPQFIPQFTHTQRRIFWMLKIFPKRFFSKRFSMIIIVIDSNRIQQWWSKKVFFSKPDRQTNKQTNNQRREK